MFVLSYFGDYFYSDDGDVKYVDTTVFLKSKEEVIEQIAFLDEKMNTYTISRCLEVLDYKDVDIKELTERK